MSEPVPTAEEDSTATQVSLTLGEEKSSRDNSPMAESLQQSSKNALGEVKQPWSLGKQGRKCRHPVVVTALEPDRSMVVLKDSSPVERIQHSCTCVAGTTLCNHCVALLFQSAHYSQLNVPAVPPVLSSTEGEQQWHKPRTLGIKPGPVEKMVVLSAKPKCRATTERVRSTLYKGLSGDMPDLSVLQNMKEQLTFLKAVPLDPFYIRVVPLNLPHAAGGVVPLNLPHAAGGVVPLNLPHAAGGVVPLNLPHAARGVVPLNFPHAARGVVPLNLPHAARGVSLSGRQWSSDSDSQSRDKNMKKNGSKSDGQSTRGLERGLRQISHPPSQFNRKRSLSTDLSSWGKRRCMPYQNSDTRERSENARSKVSTPKLKTSNFPLSEEKFQKKVLQMLIEIRDLVKIVTTSPDGTTFKVKPAITKKDYEELESRLSDDKETAALVSFK
ncbi:uncharacterized protein LOC130553021 [Triplophysa rosa]|uniref:uncharacterized protein LOC130553021 n=1 Tax=Triplophysa rosa TaxID=992332 RepID=UPI002545F9C7|nr:uncharacterized protein LOC130553021 [Triplophysa rosa]